MGTAALQVHDRAELWRAYGEAFHEFARRAEELQSLNATGTADRISLENALLALETARTRYHQSRDALALLFLSGRPSRFVPLQKPPAQGTTASV